MKAADAAPPAVASHAGPRSTPFALLGWGLWAAALMFVVFGLATFRPGANVLTLASGVVGSTAIVALATSGAVLMMRVPRNVIGRLLLAGGVLLAIAFGGFGLGDALVSRSVPGAVWVLWLTNLTWVPAIATIAGFLPLLYPTGRLPSPRWRALAGVLVATVAAAVVSSAFSPFPPDLSREPVGAGNPLEVGGTFAVFRNVLNSASQVVGIPCLPLVGASVVIRFRRATGIERAQLKWLASVGALVGVALAIALPTGAATSGPLFVVSNVAYLVALSGFALLPVAIGVAILRYRLYEIDRIISRTVAYSIVLVVLASTFVLAVLVLEALLAPVTSSNSLAVAASTLVVAALFQPLVGRVREVVDQRFNRARYDAAREIEGFAARVRDEVEVERLTVALATTLERTMQPASTSIWLAPARIVPARSRAEAGSTRSDRSSGGSETRRSPSAIPS
jgi:hypothetical protein